MTKETDVIDYVDMFLKQNEIPLNRLFHLEGGSVYSKRQIYFFDENATFCKICGFEWVGEKPTLGYGFEWVGETSTLETYPRKMKPFVYKSYHDVFLELLKGKKKIAGISEIYADKFIAENIIEN